MVAIQICEVPNNMVYPDDWDGQLKNWKDTDLSKSIRLNLWLRLDPAHTIDNYPLPLPKRWYKGV